VDMLTYLVTMQGPVRMVSLHNMAYVVAPTIALVAGVLNGVYVPAEELRALDWNGVPVTLGHPVDNAQHPVSARDPTVLADYGLGSLYHAAIVAQADKRDVALHGELWMPQAVLQQRAPVVLARLEAGETLEVSTGFFAQELRATGEVHGQAYRGRYQDVRPDHVAILPDQIGACSIADGCGVPRVHTGCGSGSARPGAEPGCSRDTQGGDMETARPAASKMKRLFHRLWTLAADEGPYESALVTQVTDHDVFQALEAALAREQGRDYWSGMIEAVDHDAHTVMYHVGRRTWSRSWSMQGDVVVLGDAVIEVQRVTSYVPVAAAEPEEEQESEENPEEPEDNEDTEGDVVMAEAIVPTFEEALTTLAPEYQVIVQRLVEVEQAQKTLVIQALLALPGNSYDEAELQELSLRHLERIQGLMHAAQGVAGSSSYVGQGVAGPRHVEGDDTPPAPPKVLDLALARRTALGR